MRRASGVLVAAVLVLAGCTSQSEDLPAEPYSSDQPGASASVGTVTEAPSVPTPSDDGAVPAEPPSSEEASRAGEPEFLDSVGSAWHGDVPSPDVLLQLGQEVCDQIRSGLPVADVMVLNDTDPFKEPNNDALRLAALHMLCSDLVDS